MPAPDDARPCPGQVGDAQVAPGLLWRRQVGAQRPVGGHKGAGPHADDAAADDHQGQAGREEQQDGARGGDQARERHQPLAADTIGQVAAAQGAWGSGTAATTASSTVVIVAALGMCRTSAR